MTGKPNVVVILVDDMGYSDIGCYGGEIPTPNLDRLAAGGVRMSQFYNTARCSPSRASLLTGLHPHQTGIGILTEDQRPYGYPGTINDRCATMAEVLRGGGYATYMSGKWHLCGRMDQPNGAWPTRRGFDRFFGTIVGAGNYWNPNTLTRDESPVTDEEMGPDFFYTDAIGSAAADFITTHAATHAAGDAKDRPFFLYTAFTAPHWPLHASEADIEAMRGRYAEGWDVLRERRNNRQVELGVLDSAWALSDRDPDVRATRRSGRETGSWSESIPRTGSSTTCPPTGPNCTTCPPSTPSWPAGSRRPTRPGRTGVASCPESAS
jgi:arylsulfatase A-like enzyme